MKRLGALLACWAMPLAAHPHPSSASPSPALRPVQGPAGFAAGEPTGYISKLQRLNAVGWRLARGNAPFCERTRTAIGWILHDAETYPDPASIQSDTGAALWIATVAPDSPAERAGLKFTDIPVRVGALDLQATPVGATPWQRLIDLDAQLSQIFANGPTTVEWRRQGEEKRARVTAQTVCFADFEVRSGKDDAIADRRRVMLGEDFRGFDYGEATLAALVAHELAHVVLGHDGRSASNKAKRTMEREADRLMPWLLANAGYDPAAAAEAIRLLGPSLDRGLRLSRRHDRWPDRVAQIEAETALVQEAKAQGRPLDWRARFAEP